MFAKWERYLFLALLIVAITFIIGEFIAPLALGIILAIAIYPLHQKILKGRSEKLRVWVTTVLLTLTIIIPIILLLTFGAIKGKDFLSQAQNKSMDSYLDTSYKWLSSQSLSRYALNAANLNQEQYKKVANSNLDKLKSKALNSAQQAASSIPAALFGFLLVIATVFFGILDGKKLKSKFIHNNLYDAKFGSFFVNEFISISRAVIISTLGCSVVQSLITVIPVLIFDPSIVVPVIFFTFFLSMIPMVGTTPTFIFLIGSQIVQGNIAAVIVYIIFLLIVGSVDNVIRAVIIEKSNDIHPFVAFMAAIGGIAALGFFGLFLGPVIIVMALKSFNYVMFKKTEKPEVSAKKDS